MGKRAGPIAVAALAAAVCMGALAFGSSHRVQDAAELLPKHGTGGNIATEMGDYGKAWSAASAAVMSVGSGITSGIFSPKSSQQTTVEPELVNDAKTVVAAEVEPTEAVEPAAEPAVQSDKVAAVKAVATAQPEVAAAVKRARSALRNTAAASAARQAAVETPKRAARPAAAEAPMAEKLGHVMEGKQAVDDINSYFDAMPSNNVNAFHEPAQNARHFGRKYGSDKSRAELDDYFNRLAKDVHTEEYPAKRAVKELTDYYAKLPTKDVTADHEPGAKKPAKKDFADTQAVKDMGDYFDKIPVKKVNPFHEAAHGEHKTSLPQYSADEAARELGNYYGDLPVKSVNAFHQKSKNLAEEERVASAAVASLHPASVVARPTLSAAQTVKASEMRQEQEQQEQQPAASKDEESETPAAAGQQEESSSEGTDPLVSWQEVDNRHVYDNAKTATKPAAAQYRTLKDDTTFSHTKYQLVPGSDGKIAKRLARDEKKEERHLRQKSRNWASLSDQQGRDADAPKLSEAERHAGGYDTQYGLTDRLGSKVIESTPEGQVVTHLVSRKYAKAFPDISTHTVKPEGIASTTPSKVAVRKHAQAARGQQQQQQQQGLRAPIGDPEGVVKGGGKLQMKARKYSPMPYWRMINRKGPQQWHAGKKVTAAQEQFDSLDPKEQASLLVQMKKSAWWRTQHSKRIAGMQQQQGNKGRSSAVRGPAQSDTQSGLRGRDGLQQQLAQQQGVNMAQKLAAVAPRHKGMAQSLGEVIGVSAFSVLRIAC